MKRRIKDYLIFDGYRVKCLINKSEINDGMIVFADEHMFIFQDIKGGGSPVEFNKINRERFTHYLGSWDCGSIDSDIIPSVQNLEILEQIYKKFDVKIDDKFYDESKNVYSVFKKYDRDGVILLKNGDGNYCKMISMEELRTTLDHEDEKAPKQRVKPDYYFEDLLKIIADRNKRFNPNKAADLLANLDGRPKTKGGYLANINDEVMRDRVGVLMDNVVQKRRGENNLTWDKVYREAVETYFIEQANIPKAPKAKAKPQPQQVVVDVKPIKIKVEDFDIAAKLRKRVDEDRQKRMAQEAKPQRDWIDELNEDDDEF